MNVSESVDALPAADVVAAFRDGGFGPFTGVPCSFLGPVISYLQRHGSRSYLAATNEGEAVAIAAGAQLTGRRPVVILQNSGLGNAVNPLTSLCHTLHIPVLLLVTWRGEPGRVDEPQHELMGHITEDLLTAMRVRHEPFPRTVKLLKQRLLIAVEHMQNTGLPFAFVLPKRVIAAEPSSSPLATTPVPMMSRATAIGQVLDTVDPATLVVATTGKTARELERDWDRSENLYVVGSMGCASSIALGIALHVPDRAVIVLDGDGAALMRMEAMATIGHHRPANLLHVLLDNEAYEATGGQPTISGTVDFPAIAIACGYRATHEATQSKILSATIRTALRQRGPRLIRVWIAAGSDSDLGRPALPPPAFTARFRQAIAS